MTISNIEAVETVAVGPVATGQMKNAVVASVLGSRLVARYLKKGLRRESGDDFGNSGAECRHRSPQPTSR